MSLHRQHPSTSLAFLRSLAAGIAIATGSAAAAADPVPAATAGETPRLSDVMLARAALAALDADPDMRGVNLVVSVVDRVAVIGGPVGTPRQARRAEEIVRDVHGINEVRNTCFVALGPDPLLRSVATRMVSALPPRPTMYAVPGVLSNHLAPIAASPETSSANPPTHVAAASPRATVVARKPAGEPGLLGAPVAPPGSAAVAAPAAAAVHTGNTRDVLLAAAEARKSEPRFAELTVELRGGTLVIGGTSQRASDAWDLAKKLQSIPGVSRIAVAAVAAK